MANRQQADFSGATGEKSKTRELRTLPKMFAGVHAAVLGLIAIVALAIALAVVFAV